MKKNLLFAMLAIFLAWAWFGGISIAQSTETATCEDEVKYWSSDTCASLSAAIIWASDGDTITLLKNINADVVIPKWKTIIINLWWYTIKNESNDTVINNWTLTIEWEWVIDNITHKKATIVNNKDAVLTINWGTIKRSSEVWTASPNSANWNSFYTIKNLWTLVVNWWYIENSWTYSSNVEIWYYDWCTTETPSLTINWWTFSWWKYTLKSDDCWKITINDWEFNGIYWTILAWNNVEINSWYFTNTHATNSIIYVSKYQASTYTTEWKVKINWWTFSWNNNIIWWYTNYLTGDAEINGGLFTTAGTSIFDANVKVDYVVKWWIFSVDPDNAYIWDKCSIKNYDWKYEVKDCPTASETFVTSKWTELPIVYDENKTIKLAETQALFKKKPIPSDLRDAAILNAIKTAEELTGTEIVEIESEDVLFFDVSAAIPTVKQTKAFRKSGSTLFSEDAFKNGSTDTGSITYDINKAVNPTWVTPNIEKVTSYNTVSKDTKVIWYTLNMDDEGDWWFYAPRMYKITFDTNWGTEKYEAQKVALTEWKATNPWIPTKEWSWFKFWSLSNEESATEYDFSAEVTGDITLYAIYGDDAFTITWKNWNDIINTGVFASWAMPAYVWDTPSKDADSTCNTYEFKEWNPSVTAVTGETTYTATFTCTSPKSSKSSWGSWGGWSSKTSTTNGTKAETGSQNNIKNDDIIKTNGDENWVDNNESTDSQTALDDWFTQEFHDAYDFAFKNGITTMPSIAEADMNGTLTRIAMAKMLSQYAINVLGKTPDTGKNISFPDVSPELDAQYNSGVTLAYQLWIMGINIDEFRPFDEVTRAEFVTALSRMLFGLADGENLYYETHMQKLLEEKIITVADPDMKELRWYVMIMLMRSAKK